HGGAGFHLHGRADEAAAGAAQGMSLGSEGGEQGAPGDGFERGHGGPQAARAATARSRALRSWWMGMRCWLVGWVQRDSARARLGVGSVAIAQREHWMWNMGGHGWPRRWPSGAPRVSTRCGWWPVPHRGTESGSGRDIWIMLRPSRW